MKLKSNLTCFVKDFDNGCLTNLAILEGASAAATKMTTHKEADDEVKALKERYVKVSIQNYLIIPKYSALREPAKNPVIS